MLSEKAAVIVPLFVPLEPDVMESQLSPDITEAVQGIVPLPVLSTVNVDVPLLAVTA